MDSEEMKCCLEDMAGIAGELPDWVKSLHMDISEDVVRMRVRSDNPLYFLYFDLRRNEHG